MKLLFTEKSHFCDALHFRITKDFLKNQFKTTTIIISYEYLYKPKEYPGKSCDLKQKKISKLTYIFLVYITCS